MSSGLLNTEWYTDPPWDRVSLIWLVNYIRNIRLNPAISETLSAGTEQFEMVPIPKEVIRHLASTNVTSASVGTLKEFTSTRDSEQVMDIIRKFGNALEEGKLENAIKLVSSSYHDANGRDSNALRKDLQKLTSAAPSFRMMPCRPEHILVIGDFLVANIQVAWEARVKTRTKVEHKSSSSQIELVVRRSGPEKGKIVGIRTI